MYKINSEAVEGFGVVFVIKSVKAYSDKTSSK